MHLPSSALFKAINLDKIRKVFPQLDANIDLLSCIQNYEYENKKIAAVSLFHRSALVFWPTDKSGIQSFEKLEFLGDSFLNYFVAGFAMSLYPNFSEGELSKLRASIVGTENLAEKSRALNLGSCLLFGKTESGLSYKDQNNILADAFEAVTAALLVDAGEARAKLWLEENFAVDIKNYSSKSAFFDAKGQFQQWIQSIIGKPPDYRTISTSTHDGELIFEIGIFINQRVLAQATGKSKREASVKAAQIALELISHHFLTKEDILKYNDQ